jgi:uncharacterized protein (TIGR02246 family)
MDVAIILEVQNLLTGFAWHADRGDGKGLAALFLPDGVLTVGGSDLRGREEIAADCYRRFEAGPRKTRHVWSNLRIEKISKEEVVTAAVQMTFEQTAPERPTQLRLNDIFDTFHRDTDGSLRIARRQIKREMAAAFAL